MYHFLIERVYYLYDVPGGETRGGHAHKRLEQLIIAASGSFDVVLDDGREQCKFSLNRSYYGLYVPNMVWREFGKFFVGFGVLGARLTALRRKGLLSRLQRIFRGCRGEAVRKL